MLNRIDVDNISAAARARLKPQAPLSGIMGLSLYEEAALYTARDFEREKPLAIYPQAIKIIPSSRSMGTEQSHDRE